MTEGATIPTPRAAVARPPLWRALLPTLLLAVLGFALFRSGAPAYVAEHLHMASFTSGGSGSGTIGAQSIPQAEAPNAVVTGRNVTVSWSTTTMSGGTPAPGYIVRRYDIGGSQATILSNCSGTITATSCVESPVPDGEWRYTVEAVAGTWTGDESDESAPVTVSPATLVFDSSNITSLPATLTGTIANFVPNAGLSFHLDSATGTVLSGSPATVDPDGGASISVTIPAGTTDAPHSVYAVGSAGTTAAASINIVIPPKLVSLVMKDTNANGKVDQVLATFDDTLAPYTAGTAPWTLANVPSGGSLQSVTVSGAVATLTIVEGSGAANTAAGSFTIALAANSAGIRDIYNHTSTFAATAVSDGAAPALISLVMLDSNANGKVDQVTATFSEPLSSYSAGTTPWTLANVPSSGTIKKVTLSSPTATIALTEGAGAADTSLGSFTVAMATSATGIRDAAGNQASFAARAPSDGAPPVRTSMTMLDNNHDGYVDAVSVTFSETLGSYTAGNGVWTLANVPSSGSLSSVSVSGAVVTLQIAPGTGAASTAVGSFTVALTASASGVHDAAGNQGSFTAVAPTDAAAPVPLLLQLKDTNTNGKVDHVAITFSEALSAYSAGTTPWTLAGVPSGGTLSSVARSGSVATLTLTEGAGTADTSAGSMTVALATSATGIRDAAGNLTSFAATSVTDAASPVVTNITDTGGATNGKIEPGDQLILTFSEALNPSTVPASTTVTLADPTGAGSDTLTVSGISSGPRSTGNNGYITTNGASAGFASTAALSADHTTITVTVGAGCTGTGCSALGTVTATPTLSWVTATSVTDPSGNAAAGTKSQAIQLF